MPIVEPEVLMDGDHDIDRCDEVTDWVLKETFQELYYQRVALEGIVLKPNMVDRRQEERASAPASRRSPRRPCELLKNCVPGAVPGIAFLSGGQSDEEATAHLDAMNKIGDLPWSAHLLLRPRAAGRAAEGVGRQGRERRRRAARLRAPRRR